MLVVDVGTNAEIVLGDGSRVLAASSPTGPAFEGAQISCGQRATADAVERVRIDPDTWEPRFKVIGSHMWSDEPGFSEELDRVGLEVSGLCGSAHHRGGRRDVPGRNHGSPWRDHVGHQTGHPASWLTGGRSAT